MLLSSLSEKSCIYFLHYLAVVQEMLVYLGQPMMGFRLLVWGKKKKKWNYYMKLGIVSKLCF